MSDRANDYWPRLIKKDPSFKAAPVSSFLHVPLAYQFDEYIRIGIIVEVSHRITVHEGNVPYWLACVRETKGYFVKLRWLGAGTDSRNDFWLNSAYFREPSEDGIDQRIHPVGFSRRKHMPFRPPDCLKERDWANFLRQQFAQRECLPSGYHEVLEEENSSDFREGQLVEATYTPRCSAMKPAKVVGVAGRRIKFEYLDGCGIREYCWFHEMSDMFQPCGWSRLHGRTLISSEEYYEKSATMLTGFKDEPPTDGEATIYDFKPLLLPRSLAEALERFPFRIGDEVLVLDRLSPGIRVGIVSKILANNYLMIDIVPATSKDVKEPICLHAGSERLLWPGFAKMWKLEGYVRPRNYRFKDMERLPREIFKRNIQDHKFSTGQFLEVDGVCGSDKFWAARVKRVVGHLIHTGFEGYSPLEDQFIPINSPEIYPVGWCHANGHPLISPDNPKGE